MEIFLFASVHISTHIPSVLTSGYQLQMKLSGLAALDCSICHSLHSAELICIFVLLLEIVVSFSFEFFVLLD